MIMTKNYNPVIVFAFSKRETEGLALQMSKLEFVRCMHIYIYMWKVLACEASSKLIFFLRRTPRKNERWWQTSSTMQ